ncbi:hypothetical protein NUW54_g14184 [Trametes sanguinea]|uniref:Uncharacterized protein n=1 Tax=Trametes sanguinea TaxID=158606 RepID=A0ACC1MDX6_9APHY|nr:hypothetical protein NUW54_g14184 [Trametes sanguinea]
MSRAASAMVGKVRSRPNAGRGSSLEKPKCTFPFAVKLSLSPPSLRLSLSSSPSTACKAPRSTHGRIHEAHSQALLHRLATAGHRRLVLILIPRPLQLCPSSRSLYTATHLTFLDGPPPPPPSTRGNSNLIIGSRLAAEARGEVEGHTNHPSNHGQSSHLPYSIALTLGQSDASSHLPLSPYNPILPYQSLSPLFVCSAKSADTPAPDHRKKRQRTRYQLDVGAYGIPKRSRGHCVAGRDGHGRMYAPGEARSESHQEDLLGRAVQVGEDAYFVRDNAMGVADGVGGWSRIRRTGALNHKRNRPFASSPFSANPTDPSPSALFARRLMHFCSEEVDAACEQQEQRCVIPTIC